MSKNMKLLIAVAAALAVYYFLLLPLEAKREEVKEELISKHAMLVRQQRFTESLRSGKAGLEKARAELKEMEHGVIKDPDSSVAMARMQSMVQDAAAEAGLSILYVKPLTPEAHAAYNTLHLYVDGNGSVEALSKFLKTMDGRGNLMSVEKLTVNVGSGSGDLRVKVQVAALMKR